MATTTTTTTAVIKTENKKCIHYCASNCSCNGNGQAVYSPFTSKSKTYACKCCRDHCLLQRAYEQLPECAHVQNLIKIKWIDARYLRITETGLAHLKTTPITVDEQRVKTWEDELVKTIAGIKRKREEESDTKLKLDEESEIKKCKTSAEMNTTATAAVTTNEISTQTEQVVPTAESVWEQEKCAAQTAFIQLMNQQTLDPENIKEPSLMLNVCGILQTLNSSMKNLYRLVEKVNTSNESSTILKQLLQVSNDRLIEFCETANDALKGNTVDTKIKQEENEIWSNNTKKWGDASFCKTITSKK